MLLLPQELTTFGWYAGIVYSPLPLGLPSPPAFALALVTYIASLPPTYSICMYMCGRDAGQWRSRVR